MTKSASVEQHKLFTSFENIRRTLLDNNKLAERLERPLAYWALPTDRRLPLALLDQPVRTILSRPFDDLTSTPGIGQKKMGAMIKLLLRAASENSHAVPYGISELAEDTETNGHTNSNDQEFDASLVSESQWSSWSQTVARHNLQDEQLGRLAPSLEHLPTVIWDRPLKFYMSHTIADIRKLKTHGEKRVSVVLEVFREIDGLLATVVPARHLGFRLLPKFAQEIECYLECAMNTEALPKEDEILNHISLPILRQTEIDLGETIRGLAEGRLGPHGYPKSVQEQSREMSVTRARIYQMLDECGKAMSVRWPQGRCYLQALLQKFHRAHATSQQYRLLAATRDLFFPEKLDRDEADMAT